MNPKNYRGMSLLSTASYLLTNYWWRTTIVTNYYWIFDNGSTRKSPGSNQRLNQHFMNPRSFLVSLTLLSTHEIYFKNRSRVLQNHYFYPHWTTSLRSCSFLNFFSPFPWGIERFCSRNLAVICQEVTDVIHIAIGIFSKQFHSKQLCHTRSILRTLFVKIVEKLFVVIKNRYMHPLS